MEGMSYKTWKNKIDMWKIAPAIPKEQQAIIVLLELLEGNAKAKKHCQNEQLLMLIMKME